MHINDVFIPFVPFNISVWQMNKAFHRLHLDSMNPSLTQGVFIPIMRFCTNSVLVYGPGLCTQKDIKHNLKRKCNRVNENSVLSASWGLFQHLHSFRNMSPLDINPIRKGLHSDVSSQGYVMLCLVSSMRCSLFKVIGSWLNGTSNGAYWTDQVQTQNFHSLFEQCCL